MRNEKINLSLLFILCIFSLACNNKHVQTGNYVSKNQEKILIINSDYTFEYRYQFEFQRQYSHGTWKPITNHNIEISSVYLDRDIQLTTFVEPNALDDKIFLIIKSNISKDEQRLYQLTLFVDDKIVDSKSCDSVTTFSVAKQSKKFQLGLSANQSLPGRYLDTLFSKSVEIATNSPQIIRVEAIANDSLFGYKVFNQKRLKIRKNSLIYFDQKHKRREIFFKK